MRTDRTRVGVSANVRCEYQCFRPGCGKWLAGGLSSFSKHMQVVHDIKDMTPNTRWVDRDGNLVGDNGKTLTKGASKAPIPAPRDGLDGWIRSVVWYSGFTEWGN